MYKQNTQFLIYIEKNNQSIVEFLEYFFHDYMLEKVNFKLAKLCCEKYDYSFRLNSRIQSICKFMVVMWHREIKARADDQTDEQNRIFNMQGPENYNMLLFWKMGE